MSVSKKQFLQISDALMEDESSRLCFYSRKQKSEKCCVDFYKNRWGKTGLGSSERSKSIYSLLML